VYVIVTAITTHIIDASSLAGLILGPKVVVETAGKLERCTCHVVLDGLKSSSGDLGNCCAKVSWIMES
jgi:hypothetical protein